MKTFKYCPEVQVGTVFSRIDRNRKEWTATVINRTEYFVDVEKRSPYQIKVGDEFSWHYEDTPITTERAMIKENFIDEETGEYKTYINLFGKEVTKPITKRVRCRNISLYLKEDYSKYSNFDKPYQYLIPEDIETAEESLKKWFDYCEQN